jgi:DNA invertase Pin-like site-specific DNA recombinase
LERYFLNIGYAWVSTYEQNLDLQINTLKAAGVEAALMKDQSNSLQKIPTTFKISLSTLYRYVSPKGEIRQLPKTA